MSSKNNTLSLTNLLSPEEIKALLVSPKNVQENNILSFFAGDEYNQTLFDMAKKLNRELLKTYRIDAKLDPCTNYAKEDEDFLQFAIENNGQNGIITLSHSFCFGIVNQILNGTDSQYSQSKMTQTTVKIVQKVAEIFCKTIFAAEGEWKIVLSEPKNMNNIAFSYPLSFQLPNRGSISFIFPVEEQTNNVDNKVCTPATDIPLEINAVIKQSDISLGKLSLWQVGDFLPLGIEKNEEISILCGNETLFKAVIGQKNNHIAVKITKKENSK